MSELIKREDAINAVETFFKDAYIEDSDVHCTDMVYEINLIPAASPWHRVEDPPQSGQECFTAYRSILRSEPEWLYDICYYTDDLARDCPLMDGAEHRPGWYRYESEYGDVECHPKYWMPIEPPKEDA